ncbi:hypothetical protein KHA90_10985 [Flavobacterium psychroterrae]|jgi:hypothetical protein|uniref:Uncharacterized protein n=1 Tax=Flavobacterium psychroterrae TaxID=2133767 RepID=A0ABS5PB63_9FLAO|nr:hypothetical protein [Flavobacterium psychroterrae]MBS7231547.1 hypothetical protein [Flavobacterium psychroterrae]
MIQASNEKYGHAGRISNREDESIHSETMETKDPAINQHRTTGSDTEEYSSDREDNFERKNTSDRNNDENDTEDPYFQKNAEIAKDLDDDLKNDKNDPDRRTLDEYNATTSEPGEEEEEE